MLPHYHSNSFISIPNPRESSSHLFTSFRNWGICVLFGLLFLVLLNLQGDISDENLFNTCFSLGKYVNIQRTLFFSTFHFHQVLQKSGKVFELCREVACGLSMLPWNRWNKYGFSLITYSCEVKQSDEEQQAIHYFQEHKKAKMSHYPRTPFAKGLKKHHERKN